MQRHTQNFNVSRADINTQITFGLTFEQAYHRKYPYSIERKRDLRT
jgi:hypothetical protein